MDSFIAVVRRPRTITPTEQQTIVYVPWTMDYGPIFCRGLWTEDYYANGTANYRLWSMDYGLWSDFLPWSVDRGLLRQRNSKLSSIVYGPWAMVRQPLSGTGVFEN